MTKITRKEFWLGIILIIIGAGMMYLGGGVLTLKEKAGIFIWALGLLSIVIAIYWDFFRNYCYSFRKFWGF